MLIRKKLILIYCAVALNACAGTKGDPQAVVEILESRYNGKNIDVALTNFGPTSSIQKMNDGSSMFTWEKRTGKYQSNKVIKSDEYCRISMIVSDDGMIKKVASVDDSLGAWQISYCREQYNF